MTRGLTAVVAALLLVLSILNLNAPTASAAHIDCTVTSFPVGVYTDETNSWAFYGHADATCTGGTPTWLDVGVQLVISTNGNPNGQPILDQAFETCFASTCSVTTPGHCCYANGTWAHTRGAVTWSESGQVRSKPFTLNPWNCRQF